ncbi:Peptidase S54 [Macleaya cordata]|uniref:Peptidase S54 n=1 Tax=Macleaya cordata TaxID=56857 RepID=A0A200QVT9_MACCD|nr:Peptidase S54 [Macleaya cordata]
MQKLQLSFRLLSKIPRNLSNSNSFHKSHLCKNFVGSLSGKQLFNSSITQPHSLSNFRFNSSSPWLSHHSFSEKWSAVFGNPLLVKQLFSNTHLKFQSISIIDRGALFLRAKFPRHRFESNQGYSSWRRLGNSWFPTANDVVLGLVVTNVAVFMLWRIADPAFMRKHFMISVDNFTSGRVHTLITSAFSHMELEHLFSNMLGLYFFGRSIGEIFGPQFLLKLYLAGAVGGSIFYLVHYAFMDPSPKGSGMFYVDPKRIPGLGASGAVNAIMLLDIFLFPRATLYFNFFIPVPAILFGAFLIVKDLLRMKEGDSQISGSAHLGGAAVAGLAWVGIKRRWF